MKSFHFGFRKRCYDDKIFHFDVELGAALVSYLLMTTASDKRKRIKFYLWLLEYDRTTDISMEINFNFHSKLSDVDKIKQKSLSGDEKLFLFILIVIEMHFAMSGAENARSCNAP